MTALTWTTTDTTPYDTDQESESIGIGNLVAWGLKRESGLAIVMIGNGHTATHHTTGQLRAFALDALALADAVEAEALR
jgi:hypothetical protein